jgi:protein-disulfide isomerase
MIPDDSGARSPCLMTNLNCCAYRFLFAAFLVLCFSQAGRAQERAGTEKDLRQAISALTEEVKALAEKQDVIATQLKELKQLLEGNLSGPPTAQPPSTIPVHGELFRGDKTARVAIIEYADFECPVCGKFAHETYPQILENYIKTGKVKYFYRDLTLAQHAHAIPAARAAHCAGEQGKFWEMHDSLLSNQAALEPKDTLGRAPALGVNADELGRCLSSGRYADDIRKSTLEAEKWGIVGTPTLVLGKIDPTNDVLTVQKTIIGAPPYESLKSEIDGLLAQKQ